MIIPRKRVVDLYGQIYAQCKNDAERIAKVSTTLGLDTDTVVRIIYELEEVV